MSCRLIQLSTDDSYEVEDDMLLNPTGNPFNYRKKGYRMKFEVARVKRVRLPVSSGQSIHLLCQEDRFLRAQLHAVRLDILSRSISENRECITLESRILSSKTRCGIPPNGKDSSGQEIGPQVEIDFGDPLAVDDPVRSCSGPLHGLDNHPARAEKVHRPMLPEIRVNGEMQQLDSKPK